MVIGVLAFSVATTAQTPVPKPVTRASLLAEVREDGRRLSTFINGVDKDVSVPILVVAHEQYDGASSLLDTLSPDVKRQVGDFYKDLLELSQSSVTVRALVEGLKSAPLGMGKTIAAAQRQNLLSCARTISPKAVVDALDPPPSPKR
jgi:hypothetical protein